MLASPAISWGARMEALGKAGQAKQASSPTRTPDIGTRICKGKAHVKAPACSQGQDNMHSSAGSSALASPETDHLCAEPSLSICDSQTESDCLYCT